MLSLIEKGHQAAFEHYMKWGNLYGHEYYLQLFEQLRELLKRRVV